MLHLVRGNHATSNDAMVQHLEDSNALRTPECIAAFRAVDRGHFWVPGSGGLAYADMPLRRDWLHQSAPHIYASALESLMPLGRGMSFLNVGSGTGYFSSVVSELIGESAPNDGLDIWPETVAHATQRCAAIGKHGVCFTLGNVYQLDVGQGIRYDRIYLGACASSSSEYLYQLLNVGGVLVGPFEAGHLQQLRRVVRRTETRFDVEYLSLVRFACLVEPEPSEAPPVEGSPGCGLPGVPFTFALREVPWSRERRLAYPASFGEVATAVALGRPRDPGAAFLLPEIWTRHVLPFCSRRWFEVPQPPPAPVPSQALAALAMAGGAARRAVLLPIRKVRDRLGSGVSETSDGGSTRASSASSPRSLLDLTPTPSTRDASSPHGGNPFVRATSGDSQSPESVTSGISGEHEQDSGFGLVRRLLTRSTRPPAEGHEAAPQGAAASIVGQLLGALRYRCRRRARGGP